jgi:hypothetical protein
MNTWYIMRTELLMDHDTGHLLHCFLNCSYCHCKWKHRGQTHPFLLRAGILQCTVQKKPQNLHFNIIVPPTAWFIICMIILVHVSIFHAFHTFCRLSYILLIFHEVIVLQERSKICKGRWGNVIPMMYRNKRRNTLLCWLWNASCTVW